MPIHAHEIKTVNVSLVANPQVVSVGQPVYLTATAEKKSALSNYNWVGATSTGIIYDKSTGNYVATATFIPSATGEYTIEFTIFMGGGFEGDQSITITVN